jgi:hypothetical protein
LAKYRGAVAARLSAELVVVIAGILLGLWIDDARQTRASDRLATAQLEALRNDLLENQARLGEVRSWQDSVVAAGRVLLGLHAGTAERPSDVAIARLANAAMSWFRFEPVTGAYDAMVASGDITRLKDQHLLRQLASFSGDIRGEFEDQDESMRLVLELRRLQAPHGLDAFDPVLLNELEVLWTPSSSALSAMVADPRFAVFLATRTRLEMNRAELYERLDEAIASMLAAIDLQQPGGSAP